MTRTILHVDMDAFFASVEEREDPALAGRPVVVGADPKGGRGRGVVAAASYPARAFGLRSAMPISEAYRRCPHAVYLRPRLGLYGRVSKRIFAILESFTDLVEPLSIDEAFLDVTASRQLHGDGPEIARKIRARILGEEGLTASVGVAASKFMAKLASDLEKPDGLVVVPAGEEEAFLAPLPASRLWGAGPRTMEAFEALGVRTIGDVRRLGERVLVDRFGDSLGRHFWALSRGVDPRPVEPDRERKSLGKETTFSEDVEDRQRVERTLLELSEEVGRSLRRRGLAGSCVTLKLRWEGFETLTRQTTLAAAVDTTGGIWPVARRLFREADRGGRRIRLVGVTVSRLQPRGRRQLSLFGEGNEAADRRISRAMDSLRERFGEEAVTRAALIEVGGRERRPARAGRDTDGQESAGERGEPEGA